MFIITTLYCFPLLLNGFILFFKACFYSIYMYCVCLCVHMHACVCVYCVCAYCVCLCVCMHACMCVYCVCVCVYCVCMHTQKRASVPGAELQAWSCEPLHMVLGTKLGFFRRPSALHCWAISLVLFIYFSWLSESRRIAYRILGKGLFTRAWDPCRWPHHQSKRLSLTLATSNCLQILRGRPALWTPSY